MRAIILATVHLVGGIHVIDVLCGNYLYFSPMPSAYGPRIYLKIKLCSVLFLSLLCISMLQTRILLYWAIFDPGTFI